MDILRAAAAMLGLTLIFIILWDGFQTIVLPRRVTQSIRLTRFFYLATWKPWRTVSARFKSSRTRENVLSFYGPLSLLVLLSIWALGFIIGFALIQWSLGSQVRAPEANPDFWTDLYMSGVTFFTLGFGDVIPITPLPRIVTVMEAGVGFGFLAIIIGYLPVMYQAFSQREVNVSLLDERAGSPPTAAQLLLRHSWGEDMAGLNEFLRDWERWSAELLESHLSYPVLGYFRSQHENQSWVAALTMVLDASALVIMGVDGVPKRQAQLTFAMARHAAVDLTQIFDTPPLPPEGDRLPATDLSRLRALLAEAGVKLREGDNADEQLTQTRVMYEPYVHALAHYLLIDMPPWLPTEGARDVWQTTAWEQSDRAGIN